MFPSNPAVRRVWQLSKAGEGCGLYLASQTGYVRGMKVLCCALSLLMALSLKAGELRTFKNTKGEEIKAAIITATAKDVELQREDGKKFTVPLASLSEADQAWVADWRKTHKHFKVEVSALVKKGNSRVEKGAALGGKDLKGNDCWYVLTFNNKTTVPLNGLRIEYIFFAPDAVNGQCGALDVKAVPAGKTGQAVTEKMFVEQAQQIIRSGTSNAVRFSESTLAGIHAELLVDGKPGGTFTSGKVPADAGAQLQVWREKQPPPVPKPETPEKSPSKGKS